MLEKLFRNKPTINDNHSAQPNGAEPASDRASDQAADNALIYASDNVHPAQSGRVIANENELEILQGLHKFGWLTSRQVAAWVWPHGSQQVQMARRTLSRLNNLGQLLKGTLPNGVPIYGLSASGASRLGELGIRARSGKDIRVSRWQHRAICNWYAILIGTDGYEVSTEHELYAGRAPIRHWCGKLADVIGYRDEQFHWVEVEHSRRKPSDMQKLVHLLMQGPLHPRYAHDLTLGSIELVTTDTKLIKPIAVALERAMFAQGVPREERLIIWSRVVVTVLKISPGLVLLDYASHWAIPLARYTQQQ